MSTLMMEVKQVTNVKKINHGLPLCQNNVSGVYKVFMNPSFCQLSKYVFGPTTQFSSFCQISALENLQEMIFGTVFLLCQSFFFIRA
jgi:hypothetical protein